MTRKTQAARPHKYRQLLDGLAGELEDDRRFFAEHPQRRLRLRAPFPNERKIIALGYPPLPEGHCLFMIVRRPAPLPVWRLVGLHCTWNEVAEGLDDRELLGLLAIIDVYDSGGGGGGTLQ